MTPIRGAGAAGLLRWMWVLPLTIALLASSFSFVPRGMADPRAIRAGEEANEHKLKAAFLAQFIRYVKWPKERLGTRAEPFVVGLLGKDQFGAEFSKYIGSIKDYEGHPIKITYFSSPTGIDSCHVLFVSKSERPPLKEIFKAVAEKGVLLVGEEDHFAAQGGVINFYWKDPTHIGFEVNVDAAKRKNLVVSSQLLKLARIVTDKP